MANQLPEGYTFSVTRGGLTCVHSPEGEPLVYALDEADAVVAFHLLEVPGYAHKVGSFVEL